VPRGRCRLTHRNSRADETSAHLPTARLVPLRCGAPGAWPSAPLWGALLGNCYTEMGANTSDESSPARRLEPTRQNSAAPLIPAALRARFRSQPPGTDAPRLQSSNIAPTGGCGCAQARNHTRDFRNSQPAGSRSS
jgi:hypothetical protein